MRPATRVGRTVLHPGGYVTTLGWIDYLKIKFGIKTTVAPERGRKGA